SFPEMKRRVINVFNNNHTTDNLSRTELLEWVNLRLGSEFCLVDELCTGAAYCQLMDELFPNSVALQRVKFMTNLEHEFIQNFKILQASFDKIGVNQVIPIEKLSKGRFQDNFQFVQWFKKFYDANSGWITWDYDARAVRGGAPMGFGPGSVSKNLARPKLPAKSRTESSTALQNSKSFKVVKKIQEKSREPAETTNSTEPASSIPKKISNQPDHGLCTPGCQKKIQDLTEELRKLTDKLKGMDQRLRSSDAERDFYYSKCRDIESLCQSLDANGGILSSNQIYDIMYAT
ncbi:hypothetical protein KR059_011206, partial [Drosophila kikkawai]